MPHQEQKNEARIGGAGLNVGSEAAENPADGRSASDGELGISLALLWNLVPESLPPDPDGGWFSPTVWLALSDGRVMPGRCLHKKETSECEAPVRDWFIEEDGKSCQIDKVVDVLAWMPFAVPNHPHFESAVKLIPNVELTGRAKTPEIK